MLDVHHDDLEGSVLNSRDQKLFAVQIGRPAAGRCGPCRRLADDMAVRDSYGHIACLTGSLLRLATSTSSYAVDRPERW